MVEIEDCSKGVDMVMILVLIVFMMYWLMLCMVWFKVDFFSVDLCF